MLPILSPSVPLDLRLHVSGFYNYAQMVSLAAEHHESGKVVPEMLRDHWRKGILSLIPQEVHTRFIGA
jgi:hypothetical protein